MTRSAVTIFKFNNFEVDFCNSLYSSHASQIIQDLSVEHKNRGKAIPVTGHEGKQSCKISRLPNFSRQSAHRLR
jgi:hypothetical protein